MEQTLETLILQNLLENSEFASKAIPNLKTEYFTKQEYKVIFSVIKDYINEYGRVPKKNTVAIEIDKLDIDGEVFRQSIELLGNLPLEKTEDFEWLVNEAENFAQEQAVFQGITDAVAILNGKDNRPKSSIPSILSDALAVSFDRNIGHDYFENAVDRFDYYTSEDKVIPTGINILNTCLRGGWRNKTLNVFLAGTGVGKSRLMCSLAADNIRMGYKVLYVTAEMSEEEIGMRIDANLLDIPINDLEKTKENVFFDRLTKLKSKTNGSLLIKEYPTASATVLNIEQMLHDLKVKKGWVPDIIYLDYINLFLSVRIRSAENSYTHIKNVSEEFRGLSIKYEVPIISATQLNREGFKSNDAGMSDTSESFGLPMTADFMAVLIQDEKMEENNELLIKIEKNRFNDPRVNKRFLVGLKPENMRIINMNQDGMVYNGKTVSEEDDSPVFDSSAINRRLFGN